MTRSSARTLRPLYPALVRAKKQRQVSDRVLATEVQQRFAARARRLRATFQPPEISRTYVLDLDATAEDLPRILAELKADPDVEFAQEDRTYSINSTPNDPYFSSHGTWGQPYDDLWGIKSRRSRRLGHHGRRRNRGSGSRYRHRLQPPRHRRQRLDKRWGDCRQRQGRRRQRIH
jgi:hypothetical protein